MSRLAAAALFGALWLVGQGLAIIAEDNKATMQAYAISLCLVSLFIVASRVFKDRNAMLTCYALATLSPIWFLYLEAALPGGDCWLLPASPVIQTLSYGAFFMMVFNLAYVGRPRGFVIKFHERSFNRAVSPAFLPVLGITLTAVTFVVVLARYGWSWEATKDVYLAGRAAGSGLIRRGGIGGWEVFLQPLEFMCSTVPTIAALSWVRFSQERAAPFALRVLVTACAAFLIFAMFLGGSRGNMAVYLAGPAVIWLVFGTKAFGKLPFYVLTAALFMLLIGVWEYQKRTRVDLLKEVASVEDIIGKTSFNPTETHRDNNLYVFTLHQMFRPTPYQFEGYFEFYLMAVNPIPRALWPGKPKGIQENQYSFSTPVGPEAMGPVNLGTASLSKTIMGDGFEMHHYFGMVLYAVIYGLCASTWDVIGKRRKLTTKLYFIVNSAWLFWMLWGFRSAFAFITGMYPVLGAYLLCYVAGRFGQPIRQKLSARSVHPVTAPSEGVLAGQVLLDSFLAKSD
jgi:hypothetical protein